MADAALQPLRARRTYLRILFLLLAFPLGFAYFALIVTLVSSGAALSIIGLGLGILVLTEARSETDPSRPRRPWLRAVTRATARIMVGWIYVARFERELAIHLLGADVRPFSVPDAQPLSTWQQLLRTLGEATTWKSLAYLLLKFPLGVLTFVLTLGLLFLSAGVALWPVGYFFGTRPSAAMPFPADVLVGIAGIGLLVASIAALNGIGWLWARFAEQMLGVDESRLQLAAAQAEARSQTIRAERAEQSRRELIVNASHELRTPIAVISAHVESLVKPGREMDHETRQYLTVIGTESERLSALVDDLLLLARADADELRLNLRPVDVAEVVEQVATAMAPLARQERRLSLTHRSATGLPAVVADRDRLAQVLGNLIRNAVNNTPAGGLIAVEAEASDGGVAVSVSDTGIGIDARDLPRIFDRFYRTDQSRARDAEGSGLGLAIVRDLVTAMGGTITAESTPGQGTVFRLWLRPIS